jgi:hypothetical protein
MWRWYCWRPGSALVRWDIFLVGLAWRAWLLMYTLPAALALLQPRVRPD